MIAQAVVLSFLVSLVCLLILLSRFGRGLALDLPNERSLHRHPVPRTGGVAVLAGAAVSLWVGGSAAWMPMFLALGLAGLSLLDDVSGMPAAVRLAAHLGAAGFLVWYFVSPTNAAVLVALALAVAWISNLYNFMDGSDGLAGGMAVLGFSAYAAAGIAVENVPLAMTAAAIAAAAGAFLLMNFHPARIFLGDVGSVPLGFLAGALGVLGWRDDVWPLWFPLLVFGPFIGDATLTLIKRLARRERVWQAHREHYYQRMVRMGLGHGRTAWIAYAVMAACAAAALFGRTLSPAMQAIVFGAASAALGAMAVCVDLQWARFTRNSTGSA